MIFKKEKCPKCSRKIEEKYSFCPYCGYKQPSSKEEYGLLGKEDSSSPDFVPLGLLDKAISALMGNLLKDVNFSSQEFAPEKMQNAEKKNKKNGISISISTSLDGQPKIKVSPMESSSNLKDKENFKNKFLTKPQIEKFSKLKKEEPKTEVRRFSDSMVYEIKLPGVTSLEGISIIKLENSIEIKAVTEEKAYLKLIPLNLQIKNYDFVEGKLVLELVIK